jgi:predicted outer membrane repeat protein
MYLTESSTYSYSPNSTFLNNSAGLSGGSIAIINFNNMELLNINFLQNQATVCGGAFFSDLSGNINFINVIFANNSAL